MFFFLEKGHWVRCHKKKRHEIPEINAPGERAITSASSTSSPLSSDKTDANTSNTSLSNCSVVENDQAVVPKTRRLNQRSLASFWTIRPKAATNFDKQGSELVNISDTSKAVSTGDVTTSEEETVSEEK